MVITKHMKQVLFLNVLMVVVFFDLNSLSFAQGDTWIKKADMPTARMQFSACEVNGIIYVIGGVSPESYPDVIGTVEAYDPSTDTWTKKADMPTSRQALTTSAVAGKIYAIGGFRGNNTLAVSVVEKYDPVTDTWTKKANIPTKRSYSGSSVVEDKIYVIGGMYSGRALSTVEMYDPASDTWTSRADMPTARNYLSTTSVNGKIYAIGGAVNESSYDLPVVEEYNPASNTWTTKQDLPTSRLGLSTSLLNGKIYAIGGAANLYEPGLATVEEYDPETDTWATRADMLTGRVWISTCTVVGKIYGIGGTSTGVPSGCVTTVEEYTPPEDAPYIRYQSHLLDDSEGNNNGRADAGETVKLIVTLQNIRSNASGIEATITNDDPEVTILQSSAAFGDLLKSQSKANQDNPYRFSVSPDCESRLATFYLNLTGDGNYTRVDSFQIIIGTSSILLVDDDEGDFYENYYTRYLFPDVWSVSTQGCPSTDYLKQYQTIIWFTGDDRENTVNAEEQTVIADLLDNGGKLLITGQDIGYDLIENGTAADLTFYANYLHAEYVSDHSNVTMTMGISNDPITNTMFVQLSGEEGAGNQTSTDVVSPIAPAETILNYVPGFGCAGLRYEDVTTGTRLVYLAFGFEGIGGPNEDSAENLLKNALTWLGGETSVANKNIFVQITPKGFTLEQNYPNPFNAQTVIEYQLSRPGHIRLEIYNLLGQKITTLINETQQGGHFRSIWDGKDTSGMAVPSGIYFYRLETEIFSEMKKMLLLQ